MRDALREYVAWQQYQLPEWVGMIESDDEVNSSNVKEWLRDNWKPERSSSTPPESSPCSSDPTRITPPPSTSFARSVCQS